MLEKTEAESAANKLQGGHAVAAAAGPAVVKQGCVTVKCLTEQLDKKTDADQAKLIRQGPTACTFGSNITHPPPFQMREDAIREHLSPPPAHIASNLHLAASAAQSESVCRAVARRG